MEIFPGRKGNQFGILEFQDSQTSHSSSRAAGIRSSPSDRMVQSQLPERMCIYVKEGEHDLCQVSPVSGLFSPMHSLYPFLIMFNSNLNLNSEISKIMMLQRLSMSSFFGVQLWWQQITQLSKPWMYQGELDPKFIPMKVAHWVHMLKKPPRASSCFRIFFPTRTLKSFSSRASFET